MAKKRSRGQAIDLLDGVFRKYPGSRLVEFLGEGACLQATVDGDSFSLTKVDGVLAIVEEVLESPDISVDLNRAACEYLAGSKKLEDFVTRTRQCIKGTHNDCRMSYEVNASMARMLTKGYLGFARNMGII